LFPFFRPLYVRSDQLKNCTDKHNILLYIIRKTLSSARGTRKNGMFAHRRRRRRPRGLKDCRVSENKLPLPPCRWRCIFLFSSCSFNESETMTHFFPAILARFSNGSFCGKFDFNVKKIKKFKTACFKRSLTAVSVWFN